MGADNTLVNAAFKEAGTRAGTDVTDRSAQYTSNTNNVRQSLGLITGVMDELKAEETEREAVKGKQLGRLTKKADVMWDKLYSDKENLPDKFIDAIETRVKELQDEFEKFNTYGEGDSAENEKARRRINGSMQRLVGSAIATRGNLMALSDNIKNANPSNVTLSDLEGMEGMVDLKNFQANGNISISINDNQEIVINNKNYKTTTTSTGVGDGSTVDQLSGDRSLTAKEMSDYFKPINLEFDQGQAKAITMSGNNGRADGQVGERSFNEEEELSEILGTLRTEDALENVLRREIEGVGGGSLRDNLLKSGEIQVATMRNMFVDEDGLPMDFGSSLAFLDADGNGRITAEDGKKIDSDIEKGLLTNEARQIWKDSTLSLIDALTNVHNKSFNLETSRNLMADMLVGFRKSKYETEYVKSHNLLYPDKKIIPRTPAVTANIKQFQDSVGRGGLIASGNNYFEYNKETGKFDYWSKSDQLTPKSEGFSWEHVRGEFGKQMTETELDELDESFAENYGGVVTPAGETFVVPDTNYTNTKIKSR